MTSKLYLASTSPRRKEMLEELNIDFECIVSDFEETQAIEDPYERALFNAHGKVMHTAAKDGLVIGIDTIGYLQGRILEKPKDAADAFDMLRFLSGNTHSVISGVALWSPKMGLLDHFFTETKVTFFALTDEEIWDYIDTGESFGKAASYAIQMRGRTLIASIEGDIWNVIGFPIEAVRRILYNTERT